MKEPERLRVISGGQTGVDRAALDAAIEAGIPYAGWCPRGGWAEDYPDPPGVLARYPGLCETPESAPEQRTAWNVRGSDALLVLTDRAGTGVSKGTVLAVRCAAHCGKPHMVLDIESPDALTQASAWLKAPGGVALCIAGLRESEAPGIYAKAKTFLGALVER